MANHNEPYKKFTDDAKSINSVPIPLPEHPSAQPNFVTDKAVAEICRRNIILAAVELAISCILLFFGIAALILGNATHYWYGSGNNSGTAISFWAPVLGIVTAGLGLGALNRGDYSRGCLLIAHFVMCIISALGFGILLIVSAVVISNAGDFLRWLRYSDRFGEPTSNVLSICLLVVEAVILVLSLANSK